MVVGTGGLVGVLLCDAVTCALVATLFLGVCIAIGAAWLHGRPAAWLHGLLHACMPAWPAGCVAAWPAAWLRVVSFPPPHDPTQHLLLAPAGTAVQQVGSAGALIRNHSMVEWLAAVARTVARADRCPKCGSSAAVRCKSAIWVVAKSEGGRMWVYYIYWVCRRACW